MSGYGSKKPSTGAFVRRLLHSLNVIIRLGGTWHDSEWGNSSDTMAATYPLMIAERFRAKLLSGYGGEKTPGHVYNHI